MSAVADAIAMARAEGTFRAVNHLLRSGYKPTPAEWALLDALPINGGRAAERDSEGLTPSQAKWIEAAKYHNSLTRGRMEPEEAHAATCSKFKISEDTWDRFAEGGRPDLIESLEPRGLWPLHYKQRSLRDREETRRYSTDNANEGVEHESSKPVPGSPRRIPRQTAGKRH